MNKEKRYVSDLFTDKPERWGLRGDPYLWEYLSGKFEDTEISESKQELEKLLISQIEAIIGEKLNADGTYYVDQFSNGGMSSGHISGEFWLNQAIPLLCSRMRMDNE